MGKLNTAAVLGGQGKVSVPLRGLAFGKVRDEFASLGCQLRVSVPLRGLAFGKAKGRVVEDFLKQHEGFSPLAGISFWESRGGSAINNGRVPFQSPCGD